MLRRVALSTSAPGLYCATMVTLAEIGAQSDAVTRGEQFRQYIRSAIEAGDEERLQGVVDQVVDDSFSQSTARQLLVELRFCLETANDVLYKSVAMYALEAIGPRVHVFDVEITTLRDRLAQVLESEGHWTEAAEALAGIPFDEIARSFDNNYCANAYVRIGRLYLSASNLTDAERWANKASLVMPLCSDEGTRLNFRTMQAQILDYKRKYEDAALKYYQLSQLARRRYGNEAVSAEDTSQALNYAIACAILAPAGPRRSRVLAVLYKDERARAAPLFDLLEAIYLERLLQAEQVSKLRPLLRPHQIAAQADGENVLDRAVVEHNLLAASKLYCNIRFKELGALLRVSPEKAESTAARMIYEKRMKASIDQVQGVLEFDTAAQSEQIESWDKHIDSVCSAVDNCVDAILEKYPQFAS